jgi:hypothetical protein
MSVSQDTNRFSMAAYSQGNIIESNVEACGTTSQVLADQTGNVLTLGDQLASVELSHDALQHLIDNRGQHTLIEILAQSAVDLGQSVHAGPGQDTASNVDHLQVLGTGQGGNVARFGADIIDNGSLEPWDTNVGS